MGNVDGKATAITVVTPVKPGHVLLLRAVFFIGEHVHSLMSRLEQLSFIHYARWTIFDELAWNGDPQPKEDLRYHYLFFESNFNGTWDEYIDAFAEVVPNRMRAIWDSSFGFPGPKPIGPFTDYIRRNDLDVGHYYSAYPQSTTTEILSALRVTKALDAFTAEAIDDEDFADRYDELLTQLQNDL